MINLLPPTFKKENIKYFRWQFFNVVAGLLNGILVIALIPLLINVVVLKNTNQNLESQIAIEKTFVDESNSLKGTAVEINKKVKILKGPLPALSLSVDVYKLFDDILDKHRALNFNSISNIKINGLEYEKVDLSSKKTRTLNNTSAGQGLPGQGTNKVDHKITLSGIAANRADLVSFVRLLENDDNFRSIDSPISNLIESKNVTFKVSLLVADKHIIKKQ